MKKIIAIMLSILMLLGCAAAETAAPTEKTSIGTISINGAFNLQCGLPEGYQVKPLVLERDQVIATITSEDPSKPMMVLSVAYDETYSDVYKMNELDEEALQLLEQTFTDMDPTVEISYGETGLGTLLLIAKQTEEDVDYIDFLSIYQGYFVEFVMVASDLAEDKSLTEDQMRIAIDFLTDLDFVPVADAANVPAYAGKTIVARLDAFNPETKDSMWILREPIEFSAEEAEALTEGATLTLGETTETVSTVTTDEYGAIIVNDDIELRKQENGNYRAYQYESPFMKNGETVTATLTDSLVFVEGVDTETGEMLEENLNQTGADLTAKIQAEADAETGIGFKSDNVQLTFDAEGKLVTVERFYAPWQ